MTVNELVKLIAEYVATHYERESTFLSPHPSWSLDAHNLLDFLSEQTGIGKGQIGDWVDRIVR